MSLYIFILSIPILLLSAGSAHAQTIVWDDAQDVALPIEERLPQELQAEPLNYNGFQYEAAASVEARYDDNILAAPNESSDYILAIKPKLLITKNYEAHHFAVGGEGNIERFAKRDEENKEDLSVFARAVLFANHKWEVPLFAGYKKNARMRDRPQAIISNEPLDIKTFRTHAGVTRNFNRLSLGVLGEYTNITHEDGRILGGSVPAIYSDNDRDIYRAKLKARYDISQGSSGAEGAPSHVLFADFIYGRHEYDRQRYTGGSFSGASGDRDEYGVLAGMESNYKGLLFAKLGAGYLRHEFDDQTLDDINTIDLLADIAYNLTPKLTMRLNAMRDIEQDNGFAQGITETHYTFGADYELLHDLYLNSELGYGTYDFEGLARDDEELSAGLGLTYYNSRRLQTKLGLNWQNRDSNTAGNDFDQLVFLLSLTGRL